MAISPRSSRLNTSLPLSSTSFIMVLGTGTPMEPVNSVLVTGLQLATGLVSDRP